MCVTIKKYNVIKPRYIQIRLFIAKENEAMKQIAYVNYTLNEFKDLSQSWKNLCLLIIINPSNALGCFVSLLIEVLLIQNCFCHSSAH